jgi:hypothetical protein
VVEHSAIQAHQVTLEERIAESSKREAPAKERRGGRKAAFEETVRIAVFLPPDAVTALRSAAAARGTTVSALVAEFARGL